MDMLRAAGVDATKPTDRSWQVAPGPIRAQDIVIEPDLSNAAPFLAAALVTGGEVRIPDWPARTTQAGDLVRELLTRMGADRDDRRRTRWSSPAPARSTASTPTCATRRNWPR